MRHTRVWHWGRRHLRSHDRAVSTVIRNSLHSTTVPEPTEDASCTAASIRIDRRCKCPPLPPGSAVTEDAR